MRCDQCGCRDLRQLSMHKLPLKLRGISYLMTKTRYRCRHCGKRVERTEKTITGGKIET